jgi:hypothetical protein
MGEVRSHIIWAHVLYCMQYKSTVQYMYCVLPFCPDSPIARRRCVWCCPDTSWCCPCALSDALCCPWSVSGYHPSFFKMKMDDTQTWMILLRKRWIRPRGRPGKKSRQYFCTTCSNNYGQIYNVGQLGETWNARESGAAMAATATCTSSLFYGPRLPPLSASRSSPKVFYPGQLSEQCLVWRFLFRSWCSSHYVISTHDVCVCEYSHHVGVRCFWLYAFVLWLPVGNEGETVAL